MKEIAFLICTDEFLMARFKPEELSKSCQCGKCTSEPVPEFPQPAPLRQLTGRDVYVSACASYPVHMTWDSFDGLNSDQKHAFERQAEILNKLLQTA